MRTISLAHFNDRPPECPIDTVVIHSMSAPENSDPFDIKACIDLLNHHKVSAHYLIDRQGKVINCVEESKRAWHAGASKMPFSDDSREDVNNFSIGVELIGNETTPFTSLQYSALASLTMDMALRHPIRVIIGHEHIAPSRKTDPGPLFDWKEFSTQIGVDTFRFWKNEKI